MKNTHVHVLILNVHNEVLVVSRKDNHEAFGLPGGKVESIDESNVAAAKREVLEETGLALLGPLKVLYERNDGDSYGITYIADGFCTSHEVSSDEPHVVKWGSFTDLLKGPFAEWNAEVFRAYMKLNYPGNFDMPTKDIVKIATAGVYGAFNFTGKKPFKMTIESNDSHDGMMFKQYSEEIDSNMNQECSHHFND